MIYNPFRLQKFSLYTKSGRLNVVVRCNGFMFNRVLILLRFIFFQSHSIDLTRQKTFVVREEYGDTKTKTRKMDLTVRETEDEIIKLQ